MFNKLRSLCIMFSLAFMLLGGVVMPQAASAAAPQRGIIVPIMDQEYRVQNGTSSDVASIVKAAREAGAKVTVVRTRDAGKAASSAVTVSPEQAAQVVADAADDHNDGVGVQKVKITIKIGPVTITIEW